MRKKYLYSSKKLKNFFPSCVFLGNNKISVEASLHDCKVADSTIHGGVSLGGLIVKKAEISLLEKSENKINSNLFDYLMDYDKFFFDDIKILVVGDKECVDFALKLFGALHARVVSECVDLQIENWNVIVERMVVKGNYDLAFIFFDFEQLCAVNRKGQMLSGDEILYLLTWWFLSKNRVKKVVGTIRTNLGIENKLRALGVSLVRAKNFEDLKYKCQTQKVVLGMAQSGKVFLSYENNQGGALIVARILASVYLSNRNIWEKVKENRYVQIDKQIDLKMFGDSDLPDKVIKTFADFYALKLGHQGRVLISKNNQKIKIMVESIEKTSALILAADIKKKIIKYLKNK